MTIKLADITKRLRAAGYMHEAKLNQAEDETMDDQIEFHVLGVPSAVHIQICTVGGGYCVNREVFKNGKFTGLIFGRLRGTIDLAVDEAIALLGEKVSS